MSHLRKGWRKCAAREAKDWCLDLPPLQKRAEEGFSVVQICFETRKKCAGCEFSNGVGLISAGSTLDIKALVSYGGGKFTTIGSTPLPPQLIHIAGLPDTRRRESCSLVPGPSSENTTPLPENVFRSHRYEYAKKEYAWVLPSDENYHKQSAGIAHTRSLIFLKPLLGGPFFNLGAVWEEHTKFKFGERDAAKPMATMVDQPYVNHIPTMTGGVGQERLTAFYTHHVVFSNPPDTALSLVSRTVGIDRVIDEFIFTLTHTHTKEDHATALKQLGLLPEYVPFPYETEGETKPEGKRYVVKLPVVGMEGSRKLVDESCEENNTVMGGRWRVVDDV
ncbi:hypothetical protein COCCADRAFT_41303 [Bipolaris zeicola 26-R-13]|uniref:Uncharacterized protein n=1 Tax=Cochliobolus carbonum (strain 26-R-13) TaxID=930089 RepID=W6XR93_COCC2|nr:uncharacterized protein COCCADRAFT_41303 [Bipolaris zeicola 26-R-13]EUC28133.1 hypothetical protein COCCADRAFT_41303 [Bipolaris zeicola 26-R-13]